MPGTFDPNDPGIGAPDLGEPPVEEPDTDHTPSPFPGESVDPEWPGDDAMSAPASVEAT